MKLDLQYIDNWGIWLSIKVMAITIPAVSKRPDAMSKAPSRLETTKDLIKVGSSSFFY